MAAIINSLSITDAENISTVGHDNLYVITETNQISRMLAVCRQAPGRFGYLCIWQWLCFNTDVPVFIGIKVKFWSVEASRGQ